MYRAFSPCHICFVLFFFFGGGRGFALGVLSTEACCNF